MHGRFGDPPGGLGCEPLARRVDQPSTRCTPMSRYSTACRSISSLSASLAHRASAVSRASLSTEDATAIVDGFIEREVALVWTNGDKKRVIRTGMTWKQQTLVLMLTEARDVAEADLIRWLEHPSPPSFRRDVLKQLHKMRLVEYDTDERTVRLLPPGVTAAEELVARAP